MKYKPSTVYILKEMENLNIHYRVFHALPLGYWRLPFTYVLQMGEVISKVCSVALFNFH